MPLPLQRLSEVYGLIQRPQRATAVVIAACGLACALPACDPGAYEGHSPTSSPATIPVIEAQAAVVHVPILMYHHVLNVEPWATKVEREMTVRPAEFERQMRFLASSGYTTILPAELNEALAGKAALPERPVMLTFDDAYAEHATVVLPLLQSLGLKATFFVNTGAVTEEDGPRNLSWAQVKALADAGMAVESHTVTHARLPALDAPSLARELRDSRAMLEERIGKPVRFIAYPYGEYNARVIEASREAGYIAGFSCDSGSEQSDELRMRLCRASIGADAPWGEFEALLK